MPTFAESFCSVQLPFVGGVSSLLLSTNLMNPRLFRRFCSPYELIVANCLWFNANIGTGLYIYTRRHMTRTSSPQRIIFSVFGAVIFNFGTVLVWATTKTVLPHHDLLGTAFGVGSGLLLIAIGREYLKFVDNFDL